MEEQKKKKSHVYESQPSDFDVSASHITSK